LIITERGFNEREHYIEGIMRRRQETEMAKQYAKTILQEMRPQANGPVLKELTEQVNTILGQKKLERPVLPAFQSLLVRSELEGISEKALVVFRGGAWTVNDFLDRIERMPPARRPDLTNPGRLTTDLAVMVRDEFLANEGYRRKFETRETVREEVARIREEITAEKMKAILLESIEINHEEIENFYNENLSRYQIPEMVNIREIMVRDKKLADSLFYLIQEGSNISEIARKYSVRKWAAEENGELGYFTIEAYGDLGKKAFEAEVDQLAGPVEVKIDDHVVGYSIFKVLDRKPLITPSLQQVYNKVADDALQQKRQQVLASFFEEMKTYHPVYIDEEALSLVKTSEELGSGRPMDLIVVPR
ncbi:MAG: peptidyl-prolyl cis-trans isomerase, partial [Calditrichia bacterium]|nr:peptidyl-prolyl cis-trans isomerase [Calditrichia bacterium]